MRFLFILTLKQFWENYTLCYDLSCHSADLPYLFDMDTLTEFAFTEAESLLADKMIKYWTEFARFGNPNGQTTVSYIIYLRL